MNASRNPDLLWSNAGVEKMSCENAIGADSHTYTPDDVGKFGIRRDSILLFNPISHLKQEQEVIRVADSRIGVVGDEEAQRLPKFGISSYT